MRILKTVYFYSLLLIIGFAFGAPTTVSADEVKNAALARLGFNADWQGPEPAPRRDMPSMMTPPLLTKIITSIAKDYRLRNDVDIRAALTQIEADHPFSIVRVYAQLALSDIEDVGAVRGFDLRYGNKLAFKNMNVQSTNKARPYCHWPITSDDPLVDHQFLVRADLTLDPDTRWHISATRTANGWLAAFHYSIRGMGLWYYPDTQGPRRLLDSNNYKHVMATDVEGVYWAIDGPHHMAGGGNIWKLTDNNGSFDKTLYRILPGGVVNIKTLEDGSLFLTFIDPDETKRGGSTASDGIFTPSPLTNYNPPIIFTMSGKMSAACEAGARPY